MSSLFESLPTELHALILQATSSPQDLYRLISASPACFQLFVATPQIFLSSSIKNCVPIETIRHFVAILRIPEIGPASERSIQLKLILDQYFDESIPSTLPSSKSDLVRICRLHMCLSRTIDDFFYKAMSGLETFDQRVYNSSRTPLPISAPAPLSINERVRLQRAFSRFELYCQAFPPDSESTEPESYPAHLQHQLFLSHLTPWEIEELCCVHQYFSSIIGAFIVEMEDDIVEAVLQAPGVQVPTPKPNQESVSLQPSSDAVHNTDNMRFFDCLDLTDLALFDHYYRRLFADAISFMTSLGLRSLLQFAHSDKTTRTEFIQRNSPRVREFLPQAIFIASQNNTQPQPSEYSDDPSYPNYGYSIFRPASHGPILGIAGRFSYCLIRELGYVFWDSWRIFPPPVFDKLNEAITLDSKITRKLFDWGERESVERRLNGVMLPRAEFRRIERQFGSIYLRDEEDE